MVAGNKAHEWSPSEASRSGSGSGSGLVSHARVSAWRLPFELTAAPLLPLTVASTCGEPKTRAAAVRDGSLAQITSGAC